jgi:hypothetical protein
MAVLSLSPHYFCWWGHPGWKIREIRNPHLPGNPWSMQIHLRKTWLSKNLIQDITYRTK